MLSFAIEYQQAIDEFTEDRDNKVRNLELTSNEWDIVKELAKTLKPLEDATLLFSKGTPNLPYVIPVMDQIDSLFTTALCSPTLSPTLRAAIKSANYFKNAGWELDWIQTARTLVQDKFDRSYASFKQAGSDQESRGQDGQNSDDDKVQIVSRPSKTKLFIYSQKKPAHNNIFNDLFTALPKTTAHTSVDNELALYLLTPAENIIDSVKWWYMHHNNYPCLHHMALDYLTIPATSVDVEHLFSGSHLLLTHMQNRLSTSTTCALLCLGSWSLMGLVEKEDFVHTEELDEISGFIELQKLSAWY
ncbi:hypothetical protein DXG01_006070 [Tephrocybe rancida]|nr:hypothetical protein DXG01_006070 [Tephrocybe rancida]